MENLKVPIEGFKLASFIHDIHIFTEVDTGFDKVICEVSIIDFDNEGDEEEYLNNLILSEGKSVFFPFSLMQSLDSSEGIVILTLNKKSHQLEEYDTKQAIAEDYWPDIHKGADGSYYTIDEDSQLHLSELSGVGYLIHRESDQLCIAPAFSEAGTMGPPTLKIIEDLDVFEAPMTSFIKRYLA